MITRQLLFQLSYNGALLKPASFNTVTSCRLSNKNLLFDYGDSGTVASVDVCTVFGCSMVTRLLSPVKLQLTVEQPVMIKVSSNNRYTLIG